MLKQVLLLFFFALSSAADCNYDAVHSACGAECAPSGTCRFDKCRLCCELRDCASHYASLCAANASLPYPGGGHCPAEGQGELNACQPSECRSASIATTLTLLRFS